MGRGQPGRSGTDHGDIIGGRGRSGRGRQRLGDLGEGGIAQGQAVEGDHHRELPGGCADLLQQHATLIGVGGQEAVWDLVAGQQVPELMGAGRPLLADHLDGLEAGTVQLRPLVQQADDQLVEAFVAGLPQLQAPVVDLAEDGRPDQTVTHLQVTQPVNSARLAAGCSTRALVSSSIPVMSGIHRSASTSATFPPCALICSSASSAAAPEPSQITS
jgi:hypothetical protein